MSNNLNQGASEAGILPCPFCNGKASAQRYGNRDGGAAHAVWCDSCHISTAWMHGDADASRAIAAWNRRTPAATTGDGELPQLPDGDEYSATRMLANGELAPRFTAASMQNYARAAIAADRAQRANTPVPRWVDDQKGKDPLMDDMIGYIADLRAQLAAKGQGNPVAWQYRVSAGPATGWSQWNPGRGDEFGKSYQVERRALYLASPASAQPADRCPSCNGIGWPDGVGGLMQCPTCDRVPSAQPADPLQAQRARMAERFAKRPRTAATADLDLPAPNDEIGAQPDQRESAAVPDGWKLVPAEPTKAMIHAFEEQLEGACGGFFEWERGGAEGYKSMLAAAPSPAAQPAKDEQEADKFCDANCNWTNHATGCVWGQDSANNSAEGEKNG